MGKYWDGQSGLDTRDTGTTESDSNENLETTISGEPTTNNVTQQIGQERATLTRFIGSQGTNISRETTTNHTHSKNMDAADESDNQHQAYGAMHIGEIAEE